MARLVLVGVFLLILASVVDGSSSSSRRSYRIRGSPRQSMSGLFRSLCSAFREPAVIVDDQVISGTTTVTTPFADQTGNESDCWCPCDLLNNSITTDDELRRWVQTIISGLAVDKKLVSQTIRKKTSASDDRPSAQGIGYVGVLVIVLSFLAIVFLDLQSLVGDFKRARLNIRKLLEESEPSPRPSYSHTMHQDVGDAINRPKIKNQ